MCPENVFFSSTFQEKYLRMLNNHFDPDTTFVVYNQYQYVKNNSQYVALLYQVLGIRTIYNDCELTEEERHDELFAPFEGETKDTCKISISEWLRQTDNSISKEDDLRQSIKAYVEQPGAYKHFHEAVAKQVLGQPEISKVTYNVFTWMKSIANGTSVKHNTMLAAPSGCGKTETFRAIKKVFQDNGLDIPVVITDITQLTVEGFRGRDTTDFLMPVIEANTNGIALVLVDEIDKKLLPAHTVHGDNVNHEIQSQLLTIIEGIEYMPDQKKVPQELKGITINTSNTLFICAGAFQSVREQIMNRNSVQVVGFLHQKEPDSDSNCPDITVSDIISAGALKEFIGRFTTVVNYKRLTKNDISAILHRYKSEFETIIGTKINISNGATDVFFQAYCESELGCRVLRSKLWDSIVNHAIRNETEDLHEEIEVDEFSL